MTTLSASTTAPTRSASASPPRPLAPLSGAVVDRAAVTFSWGSVPQALRYELQIADDRQFTHNVLTVDAGSSTQVDLFDMLAHHDGSRFWRVRAEVPQGLTRWSPYGRFVPDSDDAADAFRAREEAATLEARKAALRRQAEEAAQRDLVPYIERDDTLVSDGKALGIGLTMILSFIAVLLSVLLTTVLAS